MNIFNIPVFVNESKVEFDNNYIWHGYYFKARLINENRFGIKLYKDAKKQI
jgi:hypothetical protein